MTGAVSITGRGLGGRNGLPEGRRYAWRAGDARREAEAEAFLARIRAAIAASDTAGPGPDDVGYEWRRELLDGTGEPASPAAPVPPFAPALVAARCGTCGYMAARCCCPGGPRG